MYQEKRIVTGFHNFGDRVCAFFQAGSCTRGVKCGFKHEIRDDLPKCSIPGCEIPTEASYQKYCCRHWKEIKASHTGISSESAGRDRGRGGVIITTGGGPGFAAVKRPFVPTFSTSHVEQMRYHQKITNPPALDYVPNPQTPFANAFFAPYTGMVSTRSDSPTFDSKTHNQTQDDITMLLEPSKLEFPMEEQVYNPGDVSDDFYNPEPEHSILLTESKQTHVDSSPFPITFTKQRLEPVMTDVDDDYDDDDDMNSSSIHPSAIACNRIPKLLL